MTPLDRFLLRSIFCMSIFIFFVMFSYFIFALIEGPLP